MNRIENNSKRLLWFFTALILTAFVAGCGNWKGSGNTGAPDTTPPTVTLTNPVNLAINIPNDQKIKATFSEDMISATIIPNFTLKETVSNNNVPGTVAYDAITKIATFSPNNVLQLDTDYTATVSSLATDLPGKALAAGPKPNPWTFRTSATVPPPPPVSGINLKSAATFGIMATSATTSTGPTLINGNVALSPGTSQGIPPTQVNGLIHVNNAAAAQAQLDLFEAYDSAKKLPPGAAAPFALGGGANLSGLTLPPGTYTSGTTVLINGPQPVILDGGGNANAVWVFQIGSSLTTVTGGVSLINGAQAKNVYWVPTAAATIGPNTTFNGTILAGGNVTSQTGSTINGRILAGAIGGATVALDSTTVNVPAP